MSEGQGLLILDGQPYLSSTAAAKMLGVSAKTILRWMRRQSQKNCPDIVRLLRFMKDPVTGYAYLLQSSVEEVASRRRRPSV